MKGRDIMHWIDGLQKAIDYIEEHLTDNINYEEIAKQSFSSTFHFQRVFSILCGYTLGEYIRNRRLTLAGKELLLGNKKIIDIALKYGYENPDSFSRAFSRFHGVTPSEVIRKNASLKSFLPLRLKISLKGGEIMDYRIEEKNSMILVGYRQRFVGVPFGRQRAEQEEKMFTSTRAKQWLLRGASSDYYTDYCVIKNIDDNGYDFFIANELNEWTRENLFKKEVTGVDFMDGMGFEEIIIPKQQYVVFETNRSSQPIEEYINIRQNLVTDWMPSSGYQFANSPELALLHWRPITDKNNRFVEIWMPIESIR